MAATQIVKLKDRSTGLVVVPRTTSGAVNCKVDWVDPNLTVSLTLVLERVPNKILESVNNLALNIDRAILSLKLSLDGNQVSLKLGERLLGTPITIEQSSGGNNLDLESIVEHQNVTDNEYKIPTSGAVYKTISKTVGWIANELSNL